MRRADRLFELIQILRRARASITAAQLAEKLEVTPRTVYRDIATLMAMRVPIEGAAGVCYIMRPGYDLPPLMFDHEEVEAIVVGLELLRRTGDKGLEAAARRVNAKIADALPSARETELDDGRFVVSRFGAPEPETADMSMLRHAVRNDHVVSLEYQDEQGNQTTRTVLPLAVIYYTELTVLAAWCELSRDFRHFRAYRIMSCADTGILFSDRAANLRQSWHEQLRMPPRQLAETKNKRPRNHTTICQNQHQWRVRPAI
ncbi:MAG: YafY family protein [Alphaproteobacteria bacterium]|nr:YafY family protein [Alphaproteobacteria bacterium]